MVSVYTNSVFVHLKLPLMHDPDSERDSSWLGDSNQRPVGELQQGRPWLALLDQPVQRYTLQMKSLSHTHLRHQSITCVHDFCSTKRLDGCS